MPILNMVYWATWWGGGWKPWVNTVAYFPFDTDFKDYSWNWHDLTNNWWVAIESVDWITCANFKDQSPYWLSRIDWSIITSWPYTYLAWLNMDSSSWTENPRMFAWKDNWFIIWNRERGGWIYPGYWSNTWVPYSAWWHLVCIVGDSSNGSYESYKDWVYLNNWTWTTGGRTWLVLWTNEGNFSSALDKFIGQMSRVIFENKKRTVQEIADYYNQTKDDYIKPQYTITWSTTVGSFTPWSFSDLQGFYMSPDGENAYITFWNSWSGRMAQYSLSTPWDISTASQTQYISVTKPNWFYFSNNGTYMFLSTEDGNNIVRYSLSTPWDISTASLDSGQVLNVDSSRFADNVCLSDDGDYIWFGIDSLYKIVQYELTTPFDLTTATDKKELSVSEVWIWVMVKNDGKYMYKTFNWPVKQYELATPYDITSTATEIGSYSVSVSEQRCLFVSNDCKYWAIGNNSGWITQFEAQPIS